MKKILLAAFALFSFIASSQTFVSTSVENKNIILEDFTGISCSACPGGHIVAKQILDANPNDVFIINIHTGQFATPQGPGTDFNTISGALIGNQAGISAYPAGNVNRHQFPMTQSGGTAMSRVDWDSASTIILSQVSPVNIGLQSNIDMATNTLTVDVEVYYTGLQSITSNMLNIAVVQNNIEGPQSGRIGVYNHNDMLRHMITGTWGEQITNINPNTLYTNQYSWLMPDSISDVFFDPANIYVVAFVSEGNQEILSGTGVTPDIAFANAYDANLVGSSATDIMCTPTTDLTVDFKNYGNTNLTSVNIEYSINGGTSTIYPWNGNLTPGASETVVISNISVSPNVSNTVDITLTSPNGNTDQNLSNNNTQCTFNGMYDAPSGDITIEVTTDNYPDKTTWKLKENGNVIASGGPYTTAGSAQTPAIIAAAVTPGSCYTFIMEDSYGDGMLSPGSYKVKDANGSTIVWGGTNSPNGNFTSEESTYFESNSGVTPSWDCDGQGNCQDPGNGSGQYTDLSNCQTACNNVSVNDADLKNISIFPNPVKNILNISGTFELVEIYDVFGKLVLTSNKNTINTSDLSNGIYVLNINTNNSIITKRITVTK